MLLQIDPLMQIVPTWHLFFFGPHMGGFNCLLFLVVMFLLFSFLRGAGGYGGHHRRRGGYYRPGPPNYHSGHPFQGCSPRYSDVPRPEQTPRESSAHNPWAGQHGAPYGTSSANPYAGYGTGAPPTGEGQATVRVDSQGVGEGQPTVRVTPPAATMRMETVEPGGQSTTPLGNTPGQPSENAGTAPGEVDRTEANDD